MTEVDPRFSKVNVETLVEENTVVNGTIIAIEAGQAIIDIGYKMEGRVDLKEFSLPGKPAEIEVGDTVEVYLDRVENARGEAVLSREKARRELNVCVE